MLRKTITLPITLSDVCLCESCYMGQKKGTLSGNCKRQKLIHELELLLDMDLVVFECDDYLEKFRLRKLTSKSI